MRRKVKQIGLLIGVITMITAAGAGTAFAADQPVRTEKTTAVPDKKEKTTAASDKKTDSWCYGRVKEIKDDKIILETAEVVWEKDSKNGQDSADVSADFETDTMKWKLNGKTIELKTDKNTRYYKEMVPAKIKKWSEKKGERQKEGDFRIKSKGIKLKKVDEGILVKATLKESDSMTASEVLMLSNIKETKHT